MTPLEPRPSQVSLKTIFTAGFGVLAVYALTMFFVRTVLALTLTMSALLIAVAMHHVVDFWMLRWRIRRAAAIAIAVVGALATVVLIAFIVIPPAVMQAKAFIQQIPALMQTARSSALFDTLDDRMHIADRIADLERQVPRMLEGAAAPILSIVGGVLSGVAAAVTVAVLAVFMLIFGGPLVQSMLAEALPERRGLYAQMLSKIYRSIGGYLGGLLLICSFNATLTGTFLALMRIPFFLPLGLISGCSSLVPYVGPTIVGAMISLIASAAGGLWKGVGCAVYFVLYGQLEGNVFAPLVFRRTVHVNPLVVLLSILFFGELAGVFGAVLAVPAVAAAQIVMREVLRARRERLGLPPS